jgi:hypothetical protein
MNPHLRKFAGISIILFLPGILTGGCTTKSRARAEAQQAFLAGQNLELRQEQQQENPSVTVNGDVERSQVPWVDGLTLAQAIATANYLDANAPHKIIITRNGESATLDPKVLLRGHDIPLEPGDIIEIQSH